MICKIRICPSYRVYDSILDDVISDDVNQKINIYYDDDDREMFQLDYVIETDNELLIEILEKGIGIEYQNGVSIHEEVRDCLVILDNIFMDECNLAHDRSQYYDKSVFDKYESIINTDDNESDSFIIPTRFIDDKDIDKVYKVELMYISERSSYSKLKKDWHDFYND